MQIGLLGLPQTGKKTLMRLLTGVSAQATSSTNGGAIPGICPVRDPRVERLVAMYQPAKVTPATIQYLLMPDMTKDSAKNQELLKALQLVDVLAHVVRAFADDTVFHLDGSVDPLRDIEAVNSELILDDLLFVEKRLERIVKEQGRRSGVDRSKEQAVLTVLQAHLNESLPLRTLPLGLEEQRLLSGTPLLTRKPLLVVLNVGEGQMQDRALMEQVQQRGASQQIHPALSSEVSPIREPLNRTSEDEVERQLSPSRKGGVHVVQVSAKIEEELAQLEDPAERAAFLKDLGIAESAIDRLTRISYEALGLISYFTVGADEVRAWTVRRGASAAEAGGVIHSDIARGFIRAELIKYEDLITLGSEQAVAGAGKAYLKGKEYLVEDGDILSFRFNV